MSSGCCPNCLSPTDDAGLCWWCRRIIEANEQPEQFIPAVGWETIYDGDTVWIHQLKERRMKAYARARKVAKRA